MTIPFAVWHEGIDEGQGRWVLAVERDRLLLSSNAGELYWRNMDDCKVIKAQSPDAPTLVAPHPMTQQNQNRVIVPGLNGHGHLN